jgi:hypothetical protein
MSRLWTLFAGLFVLYSAVALYGLLRATYDCEAAGGQPVRGALGGVTCLLKCGAKP